MQLPGTNANVVIFKNCQIGSPQAEIAQLAFVSGGGTGFDSRPLGNFSFGVFRGSPLYDDN